MEEYIDIISHILAYYLPVIIGLMAQGFFLFLPVSFKNWEDDFLSVLTYVGIQLFSACIIFVGIPTLFNIFSLGSYRAFCILLIVFVLAIIRAYRIIPLEFSNPVVAAPTVSRRIEFLDFNTPLRTRALAEMGNTGQYGKLTYAAIKERLPRKRPDRMDRIVES